MPTIYDSKENIMYEFTWIEDGKTKSRCMYADKKADMIGYLNEGVCGGWIENWDYTYSAEEW